MNIYTSILIVDDEKNTREGLKTILMAQGYEVDAVGSPYDALEIIRDEMPDIVLTDVRMPQMDGLELLLKARSLHKDVIVVVMTAYGTVENAVKAMQSGAFHYLMKPLNTSELLAIIDKAKERKKLIEENRDLKSKLEEKNEFSQIVYNSEKMTELLDIVRQVAPTKASVLIQGESGTGKELIARMLHEASDRRNYSFIPVHCASLTDSLLSSELFGHEKGAFTGASQRKIGRFERADKGTLFLDEVGEIPEEMQVKLLRVLQEEEFERVGGTSLVKIDTRIVAATNKDLAEEVRKGNFREDLYYRLNVVALTLPALRERPGDIPALLRHYIDHYSKVNHKKVETITPEAERILSDYAWPGNVRELKNVVERMVVLARSNVLDTSNVPADINSSENGILRDVNTGKVNQGEESSNESADLRSMERELIINTLKECGNNKSKTAKQLGISRRTLYRKLEEYGADLL